MFKVGKCVNCNCNKFSKGCDMWINVVWKFNELIWCYEYVILYKFIIVV